MKYFLLLLFFCATFIQASSGELVWKKSNQQLPGNGYSWSTPLILNGNIYWVGQDNGMACFNAETGEEIWVDTVNFLGTYSQPTGYDGRIFLGRTYDTLSAINASNGEIIWNRKLSANKIMPIVEEHLFLSTNDSVLCLNTSTGATVWKSSISGQALVYDKEKKQLIVGDRNKGEIFALEPSTGNVLWDKELSDSSTIVSAFALSDSILIIQPNENFTNMASQKFYGFNLNTNQEIWVFADSSFSNSIPAIFDDKAFFGKRKSIDENPQQVMALQLLTGKVLWSKSIRDPYASNIPYVLALDGKVFFENSQPQLPFSYICADTANGDTLFTTQPNFENPWPLTWGSPLIYNNKLYGVKDGEGIFCFDIGEVSGNWNMIGGNRYGTGSYVPGLNQPPTSIETKNSFSTPMAFELKQNYPNPFNPTTVISYQIPANNFVQLKVYDVLGREVVSLVNQVQIAGSYNVNFNANNLSSGIYIYRIESGEFSQSKKMMLIK